MSNWEDTVMSDEQVKELVKGFKYGCLVKPSTAINRAIRQAQAEIAFKAGAKAVVKLAVENDLLCSEQWSNDCVVCRNFYNKLHEELDRVPRVSDDVTYVSRGSAEIDLYNIEELDRVSSPPPKHSHTTPSRKENLDVEMR